MQLTQFAEYALRVAIYLALNRGKNLKLAELSQALNIPATSLSQSLRWLAAKRIIVSRAGFQGGYRMLRDPAEVNLRQVIEAVEGLIFYNDCLIHGAPCAAEQNHWCPIHEVWEEAKNGFLKTLERYSLKELAERASRWNMVDTMLKELVQGVRENPGPGGTRR